MDYHIALSPELDIQLADFVKSWNDDTEAREEAEASLSHPLARTMTLH